MTTSAAIAPGANSFSLSPARGTRFSSQGSTSDPTAGVMSAPDRDNAPSSDSGSSEGSAFHSVLHQFYSQADSSRDGNDDEKQSGGKDRKTKDVSSLTSATMLFPLTEDGTQFRNVPSIPQASTGSDEPTEAHSDPSGAATSDDAAKTSSPGADLIDPSLMPQPADQQSAANPTLVHAASDAHADSNPASQDTTGREKRSFVPRVSDPVATPSFAKADNQPKAGFNGTQSGFNATKAGFNGPKAGFNATKAGFNGAKPDFNATKADVTAPKVDGSALQADTKSSQPTQTADSTTIKTAPTPDAPVDASPVDDNNFRSVLSQIYFSKPDASGSARPAKDTRAAEPASNPRPVSRETAPPSQPANTTPDATTSATPAPVIAADPPAAPVQPANSKDSSLPGKTNVSQPPLEARPASKAPAAPSGELAFAARLTPTDGSSENENSTPASDPTDSRSPVPPMAERATVSDSATSRVPAGVPAGVPATLRTGSEPNRVSSPAPDEAD